MAWTDRVNEYELQDADYRISVVPRLNTRQVVGEHINDEEYLIRLKIEKRHDPNIKE